MPTGAHDPYFKTHQPVIAVRRYLDTLHDTSEDPLDTTEDQGDEDAIGDDLPRD